MAETKFDYWAVGAAIVATLTARTFADGDPMVLHESRNIPGGRVCNVLFDGRDDQPVAQEAISGGQRKAVLGTFLVDIYQSSVDATEASRLASRMLDDVEIALLGDRTLSGNVANLELGSVVLANEPYGKTGHYSMASLRVLCYKTITTA